MLPICLPEKLRACRYWPSTTNHAPQTANCRKFIADKLSRTPMSSGGASPNNETSMCSTMISSKLKRTPLGLLLRLFVNRGQFEANSKGELGAVQPKSEENLRAFLPFRRNNVASSYAHCCERLG